MKYLGGQCCMTAVMHQEVIVDSNHRRHFLFQCSKYRSFEGFETL